MPEDTEAATEVAQNKTPGSTPNKVVSNRADAKKLILSSLIGNRKDDSSAAHDREDSDPGHEQPPGQADAAVEGGDDEDRVQTTGEETESEREEDASQEATDSDATDESESTEGEYGEGHEKKPWWKHKLEKKDRQLAKREEELNELRERLERLEGRKDSKPTAAQDAPQDVVESFMTPEQKQDLQELREQRELRAELQRVQQLYAEDPDAGLAELKAQGVSTHNPEAWFQAASTAVNDKITALAPLERLHRNAAKAAMRAQKQTLAQQLKQVFDWYGNPETEGMRYIEENRKHLPAAVRDMPGVDVVLAKAWYGEKKLIENAGGRLGQNRPATTPSRTTPKKPVRSQSQPKPVVKEDPARDEFREKRDRGSAVNLIKAQLRKSAGKRQAA